MYMGRAISFKFRGPLGKHQPGPVPTGLNWDAWLGPAPAQPYSLFRHQRWRWLWDFSSGDMANQLVHQMDLIRWAAGLNEHPDRVQSMGGHFVHDDDHECPNNQTFACQFARNNFLLEAEHRNWCTPSEAGFRDQYPFIQPKFPVGAIVFGTKGYMLFPDHSSYYTFLGQDREPGPSSSVSDHPITDEPHFQNWIAALRSRDPALLNSEIHEARMTMALPLLGNVAHRLGRTLHFDPKTETCLGDDEANQLLAPRYRNPYVVPESVQAAFPNERARMPEYGYNLGSTGSLSRARTPKTHSWTRRNGSPRTNRSSPSMPSANSPRASDRLRPSPRDRRRSRFSLDV